MNVQEVMTELQANGSESIKNIWLKHGIKEPFFGVKIEYLKNIQKKVKTDYELAKGLYATGNADAMYLAGLITDDKKMTRDDLQTWVQQAVSHNISEYTVPWVAGGNPHGFELGLQWIESPEPHIEAAGWATLSGWVAIRPDAELDMQMLKNLLDRVVKKIHTAPNRVRYTMNNFVICVWSYVVPLAADAMEAAGKIGTVMVDMNGTACKVPDAAEQVRKLEARGGLGKKKKMLKC